MNGYQLSQKLKKIRSDTYLSAIDQALFHELVSICNEKKWEKIFHIKTVELCSLLNLSDKTISRSRKNLADAGLITFDTCRDKKIGCYYSFLKVLTNDNPSYGIYSGDDTVVDLEYDDLSPEATPELFSGDKKATPEQTPEQRPEGRPENNSGVKNESPETSPENNSGDSGFPPYKDIKTKNKESIHACVREDTPQRKKSSRKKKMDAKPLELPFTSERFMKAWESLCATPKWKKKLNYALQISLNKLSRYEEEFAIYQIERAIESNWAGVVFPDTDKHYEEWEKINYATGRKNSTSTSKSAGIKQITF